MPLYEYRCSACNKVSEINHRMSDAAPTDCPVCGAAATLSKQISAASFRLKGAGWYETDFKGQGQSQRNLAGDGGAGDDKTSPGKAEPKADAKSETKSEPKVVAPKTESKPAAPAATAASTSGGSGSA
ncbi:MAG: FmdB family zinc ribbon protein [Panacagrimonas sp.]